jgi:hypothetical protein
MIGLGELMPHGQGYKLSDVHMLTPIMEIVRQHNLLVLSHCSEPVGHLYPGKGDVSLQDIVAFLTAFPDIRFIAAHWGGGLPFYSLMPEIQRITTHVWYDTAATIYLYRNTIFPTVAKLVGADRILFASDYGLLRQKRIINHIKTSGLDAASLELVLGRNAQNLLLQYPTVDRKNEENLTPPQADPDMRHANKTMPTLSSDSALGLHEC